jgi:hypothetical protein
MANLQANLRSQFVEATGHTERLLTSVNQLLFANTVPSAYGVTESSNSSGEEFGQQRLITALRRHSPLRTQKAVAAVIEEVLEFGGRRQFDDLTLIVARRES